MNHRKNRKELKDFFNGIEEKDEIKFNLFYDKYHSLIKKAAFSVVKNESESEDIMQMVFIKIYHMPNHLLPKENELNWLYKVTKNVAIDYIKKNKKTVNIDDIYTISDSQDPILASIDKISYNQIISHLTKRDQEIVSLKILSDLSFKQIGILLNLPTSTVSWLYYKSIKTLKMLLSNFLIALITFGIYIIRKNNIPKSSSILLPTNEVTNTIETAFHVKNYIFFNNLLFIVSIIFFLITLYFLFIFIKNSLINRLKDKSQKWRDYDEK